MDFDALYNLQPTTPEEFEQIKTGILAMANEAYIWVMDSECCGKCGAILDQFELELCSFCLENQRYNEEQARYAAFELDYFTENE